MMEARGQRKIAWVIAFQKLVDVIFEHMRRMMTNPFLYFVRFTPKFRNCRSLGLAVNSEQGDCERDCGPIMRGFPSRLF